MSSWNGKHTEEIKAALEIWENSLKGPRDMISLASPYHASGAAALAKAILADEQGASFHVHGVEALHLIDKAWDKSDLIKKAEGVFDAIDVSCCVWRLWARFGGSRDVQLRTALQWALPSVQDTEVDMMPHTRAFLLEHAAATSLIESNAMLWMKIGALAKKTEEEDRDQAGRVYRKLAALISRFGSDEVAKSFWVKAIELAGADQQGKIQAAKVLARKGWYF